MRPFFPVAETRVRGEKGEASRRSRRKLPFLQRGRTCPHKPGPRGTRGGDNCREEKRELCFIVTLHKLVSGEKEK